MGAIERLVAYQRKKAMSKRSSSHMEPEEGPSTDLVRAADRQETKIAPHPDEARFFFMSPFLVAVATCCCFSLPRPNV